MANRRLLVSLLVSSLAMPGAVSGSAAGSWPVDGMWTASSDGLAGQLTIVIKTRGTAVCGEGRQGQAGLESAPLSLSGTYLAPTLQLKLKSPEGLVWSLTATVTGRETMNGLLTWPTGTVQPLAFVRP